MKKTLKTLVIGALVGLLAGPQITPTAFAASSGHFTDLLPNPTSVGSSVTSGTLYYNGYDWGVASLGASSTPGDALSRTPYTAFQVYTSSTIGTTVSPSTMTLLAGQSSVGSPTIPAAWIALGKSIRITARGWYGTTGTPNWTWAVLMGTTSIMTTGAVAAPVTQTQSFWSASALLTVSTTSTASHGYAMNGTYDIFVGSGPILGPNANIIAYSTNTLSAVNVDLTSQLTIQPIFTWGTSSASNKLTINNLMIELLN